MQEMRAPRSDLMQVTFEYEALATNTSSASLTLLRIRWVCSASRPLIGYG